ncbi:MAG: ATP-binding protein, partial [Proteobacteria bacterium]|nr:ATP-binding protein [Pseudomonadota bacterium]
LKEKPMERDSIHWEAGQDPAFAAASDRLVSVNASVQDGVEARIIRVESSFGKGFSGLQLIGNTGQIVDDGKERARMALERLGLSLPAKRLILSVSPGHIKVDGSHLDLACAIAMAGQMIESPPTIDTKRWVFAAEIGLGGELRPVPGAVCHGVAAMAGGMDGVVVALDNLPELRALEAVSAHSGRAIVYQSFGTVKEVLDWLWTGTRVLADLLPTEGLGPAFGVGVNRPALKRPDFSDMQLTDDARLVALVAAAGRHSLLLRGAPGCGKSMFAQRLVSLLPDLSPEDHLAALQIHSAHPEPLTSEILAGKPPYRSPHHFASVAAMLGAGPCPGEVALASGGVLFLDEFPEFRRDVIEALREPLENGEVSVSRAHAKRVWRANALFVAASNNCPCGWRGSSLRKCVCPESRVDAYQNRLSGPILDRIDLHVTLPERQAGLSVSGALFSCLGGTASAMVAQVSAARKRSAERNQAYGVCFNRDIPSTRIPEACGGNSKDLEICIQEIMPRDMSTRAMVRCLRVARTIADIEGQDLVLKSHIQRALSWQPRLSLIRAGNTRAMLFGKTNAGVLMDPKSYQ